MVVEIKSLIKNMNIVIGCTNHCSYCYARANCRRFHMTDDFAVPTFFEQKLRLIDNKKPGTYLMTGMSDFADWKDEWCQEIFQHIAYNPQNTFIFLSKSPERICFQTALDNVWMGVTVTSKEDKIRLVTLKNNVKAAHYHATFEPLHGDVGKLDLNGYEWVVIGTETGKRKNKIDADQLWVANIVQQAQEGNIPIFMKEELANIIGCENMIQQLPATFCHV